MNGCASLPKAPASGVAEQARATRSYSAALQVRLQGPELRARTRALIAFERPDKLRLEIPGPTGARFVALLRGESLLAVFPSQRAVYRSGSSAAEVERLLGVALTAAEVMDLLVGAPPRGARAADVRWGARLPARVDVTLADGSRLGLRVEDAQADPVLPARAFAAPASEGYRTVDAAEARRLWSR
jgi:hypothetical protein